MSGYDLAKALGKYAAGVKPSTQPAMILGIVGLKGSNHLTGKSFVYKTTHAGLDKSPFPAVFSPQSRFPRVLLCTGQKILEMGWRYLWI